MINFCTYFDSSYLLKGLGLYLSLKQATNDFHLYVMAFDRECFNKLLSCNFENMTIELLEDFETPELLFVKPSRSRGEYCWTCGPSVIYHFLTKYSLESITYVDSDLFFLSDPHKALPEYVESSIAITEQGLNDKNAKIYGKYCVQYMYFKNDQEGIEALKWWRDSCIDWCYQKIEENRYGDQKYLDQFPLRWKNVHIINNLGLGIAPWNMHKYNFEGDTLFYKGRVYNNVFFHMHGVKIDYVNRNLMVKSEHAPLDKVIISIFFMPYAKLLKIVMQQFLGKKVDQISVIDMPFYKKFEYKIRDLLRGNVFIQWLYFDVLKKKNLGHGTNI